MHDFKTHCINELVWETFLCIIVVGCSEFFGKMSSTTLFFRKIRLLHAEN